MIIVTNPTLYERLQTYVTNLTMAEAPKAEVIALDGALGTAEILWHLRDRLLADFVVVSGDLIVDPTFLTRMTFVHRSNDCAVSILFKRTSSNCQ